MIWGKLMLGRHNVLLMDEPTNHMDMESIESLQIALEKYEGTLIFVSHDREFVSGLANRIIEVRTDGTLRDFGGTYEEFLASQGDSVSLRLPGIAIVRTARFARSGPLCFAEAFRISSQHRRAGSIKRSGHSA